ncbi:hypothetical protein P154DRAFT_572949 [Amniculicola lignicola CBS 123094]|uniref:Uncharacterized protein n=1 Tax=Amniculicola lignicola CBS 123094 TaxID=1392246 RepID=A0A6A5WRS3_9PLEO|nr:hypothetical protein P154DRAFT_572949 [Amniculicola lignicola CBS 123094]
MSLTEPQVSGCSVTESPDTRRMTALREWAERVFHLTTSQDNEGKLRDTLEDQASNLGEPVSARFQGVRTDFVESDIGVKTENLVVETRLRLGALILLVIAIHISNPDQVVRIKMEHWWMQAWCEERWLYMCEIWAQMQKKKPYTGAEPGSSAESSV